MMKKLLVFCSLLVITTTAFAKLPLGWEAQVGYNNSNIGGLGALSGFNVGVRATTPFASVDNLYLNAGALFTMKGCKQDYGDLGKATTPAFFLEIPIHVGYTYDLPRDFSVFGEFGPYLGIGLFGKYTNEELDCNFDYDENGFTGGFTTVKTTGNTFDMLKRFDFGLGFRIGTEYKHKYVLSFSMDWGLLNLYKKTTQDSDITSDDFAIDLTPSMKTRNLSVSIGYKF